MGSSGSAGGGGSSSVKVAKPAADITRTGNTFGSLSTPWTVTLTNVPAGSAVRIAGTVAGRCNANEQFAYRVRRTTGTPKVMATSQFPNVAAANVMFSPDFYAIDTDHGGGTVTYEVEVAATTGTSTVTVTVGASTPNPYTYLTLSDGESVLTAEVVTLA